ncbi:DUF6177 family protein [Streptomyces sp. MS19]|uniref:DUF6177 family protein n=1 Tax=Streptomyces sp. MS19 TaxID=3385972 RepID=UPI00399FB653
MVADDAPCNEAPACSATLPESPASARRTRRARRPGPPAPGGPGVGQCARRRVGVLRRCFTRDRAARDLVLAAAWRAVRCRLTGRPPAGWGTAEPARVP